MIRTRESASTPTHRAATLNGCHGFGYASVELRDEGQRLLRGRIALEPASSRFLVQTLRERVRVTYSGVVYDGPRERFVTCGVAVERVRDDGTDCVVEFIAAPN